MDWNSVANIALCAFGTVLAVVWIVSIVRWDGEIPCEPEDCENCPYKGGDCEKQVKQRKENSK